MEEADLLIKELRIDNELLLSSDYNPLKQIFENKKSNMSYRNTYHRVEKVMEGIINLTYKGFSDSVLSYMEFYNLNNKNIELLKSILKLLNELASIRFYTEDIKHIFDTTNYLKIKCDIVNLLVDVNKFMNTDIFRSQDIIKENKLYFIEGIDLLRNDITKEINKFMKNVYSKVQEYIFKDVTEYKDFIRLIKMHDKIQEFDKFLIDNFLRFNIDYDVIEKVKLINDYFDFKLSITDKLIIKEEIDNTKEDNTILLLDDSYFIKINYITNTLLVYNYINLSSYNINLIVNKIKDIYNNREVNFYVINTLVLIYKRFKNDNVLRLFSKYTKKIENIIQEEVLYLFDIFYREGNYTNDFYIKKILNVINNSRDIININSNVNNNSININSSKDNSRDDNYNIINIDIVGGIVNKINEYTKNIKLDEPFKNKLRLLDEIFGEYTDEKIQDL